MNTLYIIQTDNRIDEFIGLVLKLTIKLCCQVLLICFIFAAFFDQDCLASGSTYIEQVEFTQQEGWQSVNLDIRYELSSTSTEALQNGIALSWIIRFQLKEGKGFWHETLVAKQIRLQIQYHSVLNQYLVKQNEAENSRMFSTLKAALEEISRVRSYRLFPLSELDLAQPYYLNVKVEFDRESLPVPLRPIAYFDKQWALSSDWSRWQLQN